MWCVCGVCASTEVQAIENMALYLAAGAAAGAAEAPQPAQSGSSQLGQAYELEQAQNHQTRKIHRKPLTLRAILMQLDAQLKRIQSPALGQLLSTFSHN
jgi:hypothetical protein